MIRTTLTSAPRAALAAATALAGSLLAPAAAVAQSDPGTAPAGGAEITQVIAATSAAAILTAALLVLGIGHRSGRVPLLASVAEWAGRLGAMPGWAALPAGLATGSLICAVFGMYWDISLHIDNGRDPGPLANPSHYFILAGLFGIFAAGWLAIVLPTERPGPAAVRIGRDWYAPVGGVILMACSSFALAGFPLDDVSHRLFGQDVTLWGPTHLMLIGGAGISLVGILVLVVEGRLAMRDRPDGPSRGRLSPERVRWLRLVSACGGLLVGLSTFQGEFDFGVPQFRLLFQPVLIALAASVALVAARIIGGRGAALGAAAFFLLLRGTLSVLVGPVLGETMPAFPLYLAEAAIVEIVALAIATRRPYRFGIAAGALIGTLGVLAEWAWAQAFMPIPWPVHLIPSAIGFALPVAVAGGVLGAFLGGALELRTDVAGRRGRLAAAGSLAVVAAIVAYLLQTSVPPGVTGTVALERADSGGGRAANLTVRFDPPRVADRADWVTAIAWQGGDPLILSPLTRGDDGAWRTSRPVPIDGSWKALVRVHRGRTLGVVPVFLPEDSAIPAEEVPASARFERPLTPDHEVLQRERKTDVPGWLWAAAGVVVLAISLALLGLIGWGLSRLARLGGEPGPEPGQAAPARRATARPAAVH